MTWEIVVGITVLFGFVVSIVAPLFKLSSILTRLDVTVKDMQEANAADRKCKEAEHKEIFDTLDDHERKWNNHEMRIHDLERNEVKK
jgi:sensor histidine kinase YesM